MSGSVLVALPELILALGAIGLMLMAAWMGDRATRLISILSVALLVAAAFVAVAPPGGYAVGYDGMYRADAFAGFTKLLMFLAAAVAVIIAPGFFARTEGGALRAEYPVLILLSSAGMGAMASAGDMLTLYVGLELQSLAAYVLASFMRRDIRSTEAGLKYFVLGALASGILLYGISLIYGFTGTTTFAGIRLALSAGLSTGQLFGMVFILAGVAFKVAAVPFHMWTPDVYEGAPTPVTAFFASAPKVAAMALLVRVTIEAMGPATDSWRQIVIFSALASTVLGGVGAIGQTNVKRLLAYSSINNVGFALFGLVPGTAEGVAGVLTYMAVYIVMTLGSFLVVLQMRGPDGRQVEEIRALSGMATTRPGLAAAMAMFMFSLAGIPPLFGFWPKFVVFDSVVAAGYWPLAMVGIATSVIGAYYYLRVVKTMYFDAAETRFPPVENKVEGALIAAGAVAISPIGYFLIPMLGATSLAAAQSLF